MIQLLSSKFPKHIACFILLLFFVNSAMAGREYIFEKGFLSNEKSRTYTYHTDRLIPALSPDAIATKAIVADPVKEHVAKGSPLPNVEIIEEDKIDKLDIGGPGQPEMAAFKAVGASNMVDLFSGDFSYNIPLGDVGGYPINIFYNSGISMDQEASWVGLGWNINPGTVMRNKRGIPDDFNGEDNIRKEMNIKPQITVGVSATKGKEFFGKEFKPVTFGTSTTYGLFYNNYKGVGLEFGASVTLNIRDKSFDSKSIGEPGKELAQDGTAFNLTQAFSVNSQTGVDANPSLGIKMFDDDKKQVHGFSLSAGFNSRVGLQNLNLTGEISKYKVLQDEVRYYRSIGEDLFSSSLSLSFASPAITPSITMPLTRRNYNLGVSFGPESKPFVYKFGNLSGYYSEASISERDKKQSKPAFGYLYFQDANGNKDALLDFNRQNDVVHTKNNPVIAMPVYTYDVFSISGEGTGGGFRAYRSDVGSVHDPFVKTRDNAFAINTEIGVSDLVEFGLNLNYVHTPTTAGEWQVGNFAREALPFMPSEKRRQAAYFKNPAEPAKVEPEFLDNLGNDDIVRIKLEDPGTRKPIAVPVWERFSNGVTQTGSLSFGGNNQTIKNTRDKRTQVISYLTAEEASYVALEKKLRYYRENKFPVGNCIDTNAKELPRYDEGQDLAKVRKKHHLSEITVTQTDGRRYVYGIPVYNLKEEDVSFNAGPGSESNTKDESNQLVTYTPGDLLNNKRGKDHSYQKEAIDPYAHSFLLSGLLSPDYIDVTGDGITDDDLGTAVKFNYTKIEHPAGLREKGFAWRAPLSKDASNSQAAFNPGLKTDNSDDRGQYTYGERELWYLNSIESKNMIATFTLADDREDGRAPKNDDEANNKGLSTYGMRRLARIDIYSKAEWVKPGVKKPIKSIHFHYDYSLCKKAPDNTGEGGKLTLKNIWFTYKGNDKQFKNKYHFKYAFNPDYKRTSNDRWGTFKPKEANESTTTNRHFELNNADFPFADQDKTTADESAAAWTLNEITLPSGAKIKVDFEADDYAYVQDRRAVQMFRIAGFGHKKTSTPSELLYSGDGDHFYIFIDAPATNKADIKLKYLDGVNQLFMKLWVKMPPDQYGSGFEAIPIYAKIKDYDVVNATRFWIEVEKDRGGYSPMFYNSMQFMMKNLPSKAYPGSDVKGDKPLGIFKALAGMLFNIVEALRGHYRAARMLKRSREIDINSSYIRLNNPDLKKLGGGIRVKKVTIKDSWKEMTNTAPTNDPSNGMPDAEYGQEYDYTTTALIGTQVKTISSGVASYEPIVGAEENPFREIMNYNDAQPMGPNERGAIEMPLGEIFYPSASVGYSKVTVRSIHRTNVKSGVGKTVTEYYTTKDFPTKSDFTRFDGNSHVRFKSNPILRILKLDVREAITLSQGFRIQTNDMNGKVRTQATYDEAGKQITFTENIYRITKTGENSYSFNNEVPMISNPANPVQSLLMGKEIEVMTDFREHVTKAVTFNMNFNVNVNSVGAFPIPVPSIIIPVHFAESGYRSAAVLKVINTFGILEKVRHINKGSEVSTKDLVYDAETGNVLVTETNNEFNKPVYSFNYPAHWAYGGMKGAYINIDAVYDNVRFQNGKLTSPEFDMTVFESGDELFVSDYSEKGAIEEPGCYPTGPPQYIPKSTDENRKYVRKIWALDVTKDPANTTKKFIFIDKDGEPYSGGNVSIKIVRSGKRNLVDASTGGFTSLVSPTISGTLVVNDATKIIKTTANTFKENWRVDQAWYTHKETVTVVRQAPTTIVTLPADSSNSFAEYATRGERYHDNIFWDDPSPGQLLAEYWRMNGKRNRDFFERSWVKFDFSALTGSDRIKSATINLYAHRDYHNVVVHQREFPLCPDGSVPVYNDIDYHNANSPHHAIPMHRNDFWLSRLLKPWPSNSLTECADWFSLYKSTPRTDGNNAVFVPGTLSTSAKNFQVSAKRMVEEMLKDKLAYNVPTALRINLHSESTAELGEPARVCFWGYGVSNAPTISVERYTCNTSYPIIYEGPLSGIPDTTNPPAGYAYCVTTETAYSCLSHFAKTRMNPYTKGVLGNWRADVGYVYYANRVESNAATETEALSKGGVIATNYRSFWITGGEGIVINSQATTGTVNDPAPWKWNSKVTQFNSKGFELENTDPLGRYNAGLYGYDKSLPIAVANNSKLRNAAFDGFEDYAYSSNNCAPFCKPVRHLVINDASAKISTSVSHSGIYSLKTVSGTSISATAAVSTAAADALGHHLKINNTVTSASGSWVLPNGNGVKGDYYNFGPVYKSFLQSNTSWHNEVRDEAEDVLDAGTGYIRQSDPYVSKTSNGNLAFLSPPGVQPPLGIGNRPGTDGYDYYCVSWHGRVQAQQTGWHQFQVLSDDGMRVFVDGVQANLGSDYFNHHGAVPSLIFQYNWTVGSTHTIRIDYYEEEGASSALLTWKPPGATEFVMVPKDYLYRESTDANNTLISGSYDCVKPNIIQVQDNALTDVFSPVQGQKMVFSVWVKEGTADCHCSNYATNKVDIFFNNSSTATATFVPAGKVIEGWQRYEGVFTIPGNATTMEIKLSSTGSTDVYWDDLRLHPFNANMKSFAYHPLTLRLMAENDENNYSTFYEYDDEGTLTRVKKETLQGIKTITETRSSLQKKIND